MGGYWNWSVQAVLWLQAHAGGWHLLMQALSFLGTEEFLLALGITLYWCIDASLGMRVGFLLTVGFSLGGLLKMAFHMPRPYWLDARVRAMAAETTYGLPSIHSITSWSVLPWLGGKIQSPWGLAAGALLAAGVSLSRMVLGVHFPGDVIGGFAVGIGILVCAEWCIRHVGPALERAGIIARCGVAAAASAALLLAQAGVLWAIRAVADPAEWAQNAARINIITPRSPEEIVTMAGLILGLGAGLACQRRWAQFDAGGNPGKRAVRFLFGFVIMLVIWRGLPILWNEYNDSLSMVLRYVRYGLVGFWAVFLAPWLFLRMKLAEAKREDAAD